MKTPKLHTTEYLDPFLISGEIDKEDRMRWDDAIARTRRNGGLNDGDCQRAIFAHIREKLDLTDEQIASGFFLDIPLPESPALIAARKRAEEAEAEADRAAEEESRARADQIRFQDLNTRLGAMRKMFRDRETLTAELQKVIEGAQAAAHREVYEFNPQAPVYPAETLISIYTRRLAAEAALAAHAEGMKHFAASIEAAEQELAAIKKRLGVKK